MSVRSDTCVPEKRIRLQCDHIVIYQAPWPKVDDTVYCRYCQDYRVVVTVLDEIHVRCAQCRYSRMYGRDVDGASRAASRHAMKHGHKVEVRDNGEVLETIDPVESGQTTLPYDTVLERRAAQVRANQAALRNYLDSRLDKSQTATTVGVASATRAQREE